MPDTFVYIIDLPTGINEVVLPCEDGFTIYLSASLSPMGRERAYRHALGHIEKNDFEGGNVQGIEALAHRR